MEIMNERFGQGAGWPQKGGGPHQPRQPPPGWNGSPYGGGNAARPSKRSKSTNHPHGAPTAALAMGPSPIVWITLQPGAPLMDEGLPALAPLLQYNSDLQHLLSQSQNILYELVGDNEGEAPQVTMTHDAEGGMFPEVVQAAVEQGLESLSICVAMLPGEGLWAVGMGGKWKQREQAARMALCVAVAANTDNVDKLHSVTANNPDFMVLCDGAGIELGPDEARKGQVVLPPTPKGGRAPPPPSMPMMNAQDTNNGTQAKMTLPRDTPIWIELPVEETPEVLMSMPPQALVVSTDGKSRKALYTNADKALEKVLGEEWKSEVEYHDDAGWENFPTIGARLTEIAPAEECMTVAVCSSRDVWAVGVGMQSKNRYNAAKLALATSLAMKLEESGEDCDLAEVSNLEEFIQQARTAREG